MSQPAINVGSKVKITRVRDRIPADLVKLLLGNAEGTVTGFKICLLYTSPSPRDRQKSRMPSSA